MNLFHIDAFNSGKVILEKLNVVIRLTSALFCLSKLINKYEQTVLRSAPTPFSMCSYGPSAKRAGHKSNGKNEDPCV